MNDTNIKPVQFSGPVIKRMIDINIRHITSWDMLTLITGRLYFPRSSPHAYGLVLFVSSDDVEQAVSNLRAHGYSEALITIYEMAAATGGDVMLVNFDGDAPMVEGLPTFKHP